MELNDCRSKILLIFLKQIDNMELTSKDLRMIELFRQYNEYTLEQKLDEFHNLIDSLLYLHETLADEKISIQSWQKDSEILLFKFSLHGMTLHDILTGLTLKSSYFERELHGKRVIDISSSKVVLRSQLETFLMYHYIYINPSNDELKQLRYYAWIYSSLLQRQGFPSKTSFAKEQKKKDAAEMKKIQSIISKLTSFKELSDKQQKALFERGSGKLFMHWSAILEETGFSENHSFSTLYNYLSMYSHSEGLSAIQLRDNSFSYNKNIELAKLDLHQSKLLVCLMITSIIKLYPEIEKRFKTLPEKLRFDIEIFSSMAGKS